MREFWLKADRGKLPEVKRSGIMFSRDNGANRIGVEVTDGGEPYTLTGSVRASIVRADGSTIQENGSKSGGRAWVDLPSAAYSVVGPVGVFLKVVSGGIVTTLGGVEAYVVKSR